MKIKIKQSKGGYKNIPLSEDEEKSHFSKNTNCTKEILKQLDDLMYQFYFKDKKDLVVLDLGANVGLFSLHIADSCKKIYSVEPTPSHFKLMKKFTKDFDNIKCLNYAVHTEDEDVTFFLAGSNSTMNSLLDRDNNKNSITVKGKKLSSIISEVNCKKVDFCKIDIEGSEDQVINYKCIEEVKDIVDNFFIEFHRVNGKDFPELNSQFTEVFEKNGYKVDRIHIDSILASK